MLPFGMPYCAFRRHVPHSTPWKLCATLNAKCVWVENDFDGMIPALHARKIDAILSDMSVTPKRLQQIDFTSKISDSPTRMVAKAGSHLLPTAESLNGKSIGVEQ